jgi:hypothetical protein
MFAVPIAASTTNSRSAKAEQQRSACTLGVLVDERRNLFATELPAQLGFRMPPAGRQILVGAIDVPHPELQSFGGPVPANRSAIHATAAGALLRAANPWFAVGMKNHCTSLPAAHSRFM